MTVGEVFAKAWELWKKDVGWLILAGLVAGVILAVIGGIAFLILSGIFASTVGLSLTNLSSNGSSSFTGIGIGMLVVGFLVYIIAVFAAEVLSMVFYGGMFEMVIGASRERRGVRFGDLFSGFQKFWSFTVFALVLAGINVGLSLLNIIPVLGALVALVVEIWIYVIWLYVLPLIADQGLGFMDAAGQSNAAVKREGFWKTLVMLILVGLAVAGIFIVLLLVTLVLAKASSALGGLFGFFGFVAFMALIPPFLICYVSTMYLECWGLAAVVAGPALPGAPLPPPPPAAPYASPAVGGQAYQPAVPLPAPPAVLSPGVADGAAVPLGAAGTADPAAATMAAANAWKAAADPLAAATPQAATAPAASTAAPVEVAAPQAPPAVENATTAVTSVDVDEAGGGEEAAKAAVDEGKTASGDAGAVAETAVTDAQVPPAPEPPKAPPAPGG